MNLESKDVKKVFDHVPLLFPIMNLQSMMYENHTLSMRHKALSEAYALMNENYETYKKRAFRISHSNNWLKMHHYPMKRKGERL